MDDEVDDPIWNTSNQRNSKETEPITAIFPDDFSNCFDFNTE